MEYSKAKKIGNRIVEILTPLCKPERLYIAGSIRRERPEVKDVEIVCEPVKVFTPTDLFGGGTWTISPAFHAAVEMITQEVVKGKPDGRYMQVVLKGGMKMDLFKPQPEDFFRQLAIRTGSADFAKKKIAEGWRRIGWVGTDLGLRKESECFEKEGTWKCIGSFSVLPPAWQSEEEFFDWLGIKWVHPINREI